MARIPLVDPDDPAADPKARALLLRLRQRSGRDINVLRALANHPDLMETFLHMGAQPAPTSHIRPDQRELAYLTASVANDCHYWVPTHIRLGRDVGLSDEKIAHLRDDPLPEGVYSAAEAAIVRFAQTSTRMAPISDELFAELSTHFDTQQMIELCFTVGNSGIVNRFHALFHTDLDGDTIAGLGVSPLPLPEISDHPL